ncbi:MAG: protoheme IX farnesyltransferase [Pirellulales bacterium]|nr:protoheme IX farnesyltransferase [Pirellulales bacterium]
MATDLLTIGAVTDATGKTAADVDSPRAMTSDAAISSDAAIGVGPNPALESDTGSDQGRAGEVVQSVSAARSALATVSPAAVISDYLQLTKPRIVVMILVTTMATAMIGAGGVIDWITLIGLMVGTAAVAASAGAANQIWERVIDCKMPRTASRPLPDGRIRVASSMVFTACLGLVGTWLLARQFGSVPALAGLVTWLLYVLVYTPMKTRTAWNTTVGAVAGALPVLIGYTATGGSLTDWTAWLLVGVLVAWQYPHFMAIAWMYRRQYGEAGFRMSTTVDPTGRSAALQSILGSSALIVCGVGLCFIPVGLLSGLVGAGGVLASCYPMLRASVRFAAEPNDGRARKLLRSSLLVLPAVLLIVTLRTFW